MYKQNILVLNQNLYINQRITMPVRRRGSFLETLFYFIMYAMVVSLIIHLVYIYFHPIYLKSQVRNNLSHFESANKSVPSEHVQIHGGRPAISQVASACSKYEENVKPLLLIMITTKHEHIVKRTTIRRTWMSIARNGTSGVRYVFILGKTNDFELSQGTRIENEYYTDIITGNFVDSYLNLTLKTIFGFQWAVNNCQRVKYVMKTDDDVYVNIPALLTKLSHVNNEDNFTLGHLWVDAKPARNKNNKWYLSYDEYPNDTFPDYLQGLGYVLSMNLVRQVVKVHTNVPFFPFEDIYIGMCLKSIGFRYNRDSSYRFISQLGQLPICTHKDTNVVAVHGISETLMEIIWNKDCRGT